MKGSTTSSSRDDDDDDDDDDEENAFCERREFSDGEVFSREAKEIDAFVRKIVEVNGVVVGGGVSRGGEKFKIPRRGKRRRRVRSDRKKSEQISREVRNAGRTLGEMDRAFNGGGFKVSRGENKWS